jgi:aminoglycoside 3-N-acetyltransferase
VSEADAIRASDGPVTVPSLVRDLGELGVERGMALLVHSSLRSLGWVCGGAPAVVLALEESVGVDGTIVMPAQSTALSDPAGWRNPPVPRSWWPAIRATMPPFDPDLTPTEWMGAVPECFRKQRGTLRSDHPQCSFVARGAAAEQIVRRHALEYRLGEGSPLARMYDLDARILLLGVGYEVCTALHLAEHRAAFATKKHVRNSAPVIVDGSRQWVDFPDIDEDEGDFSMLGNDFEADTELVGHKSVGRADACLVPLRELVDYAVSWMERHR